MTGGWGATVHGGRTGAPVSTPQDVDRGAGAGENSVVFERGGIERKDSYAHC